MCVRHVHRSIYTINRSSIHCMTGTVHTHMGVSRNAKIELLGHCTYTYICNRPHKRVIFAHLMEIEFLISFESLDIAMSKRTSGGFISVSVTALEMDNFESYAFQKTSNFCSLA